MYMFESNSEINKNIEKFTKRIIFDSYTGPVSYTHLQTDMMQAFICSLEPDTN